MSAVPQVAFPTDEDDTEVEAPPNFTKMPKAQLLEFVEEYEVPIEDPDKLKVGELRTALAGHFGQFVPDTSALEEGNTLHDVVKQIANIDNAEDALTELLAVQDQSNFALFRIGGILSKMKAHGWQSDADDFYDFVESMAGMKRRKAQYAIGIYDTLVELDIPWDQASKLGWSKLRLIHTILDDENVGNILAQVADMKNLYEVTNFVRDFKANEGGVAPEGSGSTPIARLSFQVHEDQKENIKLALEKAKEEGKTEFDGMALEYVCLDFLNSGAKPVAKKLSPAQAIQSWKDACTDDAERAKVCESIIDAFTAAFPDAVETE